MTDKTLENKLMEFYSHYKSLVTLLGIFNSSVFNNNEDITNAQMEFMIEILYQMTEDKLQSLDDIIDEFQETYCKQNSELV